MKRSGVAVRNTILVLFTCLFVACGNKTVMDAYVLKDGSIAGDASKGIKPVRNLIVWPIANTASGNKSKGVESKLYDVFVDKFYLQGVFDSVVIISPDRAADLLTRAGEELGLKRKPKDLDSGLVATKVGQLVGGEGIFFGTITDYDEDKTDKLTETLVSGTFMVIDAREKAYATLDSFTAMKYLWRTTVKQVSSETIIAGRDSLDNVGRKLVDEVVTSLVSNFSSTAQDERKALDRRISDLRSKAEDLLDKEEFDKSIATYNDILKLDPANADAKARIEFINNKKKEAEERKKTEASKKDNETLRKDALALEKDGKVDEAIAKWTAILEKDKANKEAQEKVEKLRARVAEEKERNKQQEISKQLYQAQKSLEDKKYTEAMDAAKKVLDLDPKNEKAKAIVSEATAKLEESKAKTKEEKKPAVAPAESKPAVAPAESKPAVAPAESKPAVAPAESKPAVAPAASKPAAVTAPAIAPTADKKGVAGSPEVEEIRKRALGYFDKEEYQKSHDEWKKLLELAPGDAQGKEMLDTTEMLMKALQ